MFAFLRECCAHKSLLENLTELDLRPHCSNEDEDEKKKSLTLELERLNIHVTAFDLSGHRIPG